ncbi:hypothetical protein [Vibrio breoganii]|uniref:hypothetical protein n=1 Tax=Vibrio breoganii TaxID=553239 RepID=UPI0021C360B7|nr:hypothetical protein [Vibrio breoganii]MDN3717776.1 hypothetical protein [Vibrio breoganii]
MSTQLTNHAKIRCQQRGFTKDCADIFMIFGHTVQYSEDGAISLELGDREKKKLRKQLRACIQLTELRAYAIVSDEGDVITIAHKYN